MPSLNLVFAYFAPETLLPVTSIIATVVGAGLMFGRVCVHFLVRTGRHAVVRLRRRAPSETVKGPHFRAREQRRSRLPRS